MNVLLWKVGRNLNRAIRTCWTFGINELLLLECNKKIKGRLFNAKKLPLKFIDEWPEKEKILGIEINRGITIESFDEWKSIDTIVIGGESATLPKCITDRWANIKTKNTLCLTVESALSIVLHEWNKHVSEK